MLPHDEMEELNQLRNDVFSVKSDLRMAQGSLESVKAYFESNQEGQRALLLEIKTSVREISVSLSGQSSRIASLEGDLRVHSIQIAGHDKIMESALGRISTYESATNAQLGAIRLQLNDLEGIKKDLTEMKPALKELESHDDKKSGQWTAYSGLVSAFWYLVVAVLSAWAATVWKGRKTSRKVSRMGLW